MVKPGMTDASFLVMPSTDTTFDNAVFSGPTTLQGITYYQQICINLVQGINAGGLGTNQTGSRWTSSCPDGPDPGLKNIRVGVFWTSTDKTAHSLNLESVVVQE